jgi:excisionase family DNA binding protein
MVTVLLTAEELAERLKIQPSTVRRWSRDGRIPTVRLSPKVVRYDYDAVVETLRREEVDRG